MYRFHSQFHAYKAGIREALLLVDPSRVGEHGLQAAGADDDLVEHAMQKLDQAFLNLENTFTGIRRDHAQAVHEETVLQVQRIGEQRRIGGDDTGSTVALPSTSNAGSGPSEDATITCRSSAEEGSGEMPTDERAAATAGALSKRPRVGALPASAATKRMKPDHPNQLFNLLSAGAKVCFSHCI